MAELKLCKEKLLNTISEIVGSGPQKKLTRTFLKTQMPSMTAKRFGLFVKMAKLADELHFVEKSTESVQVLLSALFLFAEYFRKELMRTPDAVLKDLQKLAAENGIPKQELQVELSRQFLAPIRVYLWQKRQSEQQQLQIQLLLRTELYKPESELLDIGKDLELETTVLELDDACAIIQNAERMYQSIARFNHLVDVYQKALDLRAEESKTDPLKAIIKIQAITRGFLARKKVNQFRESTHLNLGLTAEALIDSIAKTKTTAFLRDLPAEIFEKNLPKEFCQTPDELELFLKDNFFKTDPLAEQVEEAMLRKVDGLAEDLFAELFLAEAIKESTSAKMDNLVSPTVFVKSKGKICHLDLRAFFYATVVVPFGLRPWEAFPVKTANILLIGESGSGKTVWVNAVCEKCLATKIRVSRTLFTKKFMKRKKLVETICQFARIDGYAIVEFDRLEMFAGKRKTPIKKSILKLLQELRNSNCQIIGATRTADLIPEVLAVFDHFVTLKNLVGVDRYAFLADTLAQKKLEQRLEKPPKRLFELAKSTRKLTNGKTVEKLEAKLAIKKF